MGNGFGDLYWGLGVEIGDWNDDEDWGLELGIGDGDWGLGLGIGIGDGNWGLVVTFDFDFWL